MVKLIQKQFKLMIEVIQSYSIQKHSLHKLNEFNSNRFSIILKIVSGLIKEQLKTNKKELL